MMVDDEYVFIHPNGNFSHNSSPGIFAGIGRAFCWFMLKLILGILFRFVDEFIGFGNEEAARTDFAIFPNWAARFMGDSAVNWSKTTGPAKRANVLGWDTDLVLKLVAEP